MCATQLFVIYAKHARDTTNTTKSTIKTVIKLVNHAATSLVLLPNTHTPFWFSCGHLAWFARMVMRVMTLMHMFEMTLALGLGTSLVTLWRVWTPLQYMQTAQHNRPPWSCEIRGLRDADELIVLGFFLKVSHFTFRMIFSLARNLSSCCPTEVSSCRFVGKTTPLAVRMQYSYGIMHMHILAAFQCTELTSPQYICFDAPRLLQQSFFNGHWTTMMRRAPRPLPT